MFKDESNGIVCYYNENGELMCEGYDEGPHFQPEAPKYFTRYFLTPVMLGIVNCFSYCAFHVYTVRPM
jgi:hypothetical protein